MNEKGLLTSGKEKIQSLAGLFNSCVKKPKRQIIRNLLWARIKYLGSQIGKNICYNLLSGKKNFLNQRLLIIFCIFLKEFSLLTKMSSTFILLEMPVDLLKKKRFEKKKRIDFIGSKYVYLMSSRDSLRNLCPSRPPPILD